MRPAKRHLDALGIPVWVLRHREAPAVAPGVPADTLAEASARAPGAALAEASARAPAEALAEAPARAAEVLAGASVGAPAEAPAGGADQAWDLLAGEVRSCTLCDLHATRTQTVFGVGRSDADLLVIGEAPGADEDRQGEPFVGRAGQLLNAMLLGIGLARNEVYIANILKCRPPGNRDPRPAESVQCTPYLDRQIGLIRPRAILALGRIAAQWLLQSDQTIGRLRGRVLSYGELRIPIVVTYHPAYLLRSPLAKAKTWQDLLLIKELISSDP